jgi:UMF1 family MFS transporter
MSKSNRAVRAWCLYDVGHSAFSTTIMAAVLPVYFATVAGAELDPDPERARVLATSAWGYANSLAMAVVAVASPLLGALADARRSRKRWLGGFVGLGAPATALLVLVGKGDWALALGLYVVGRFAFAGSILMYDSLLSHVVDDPADMDRVSTRGYAWGYLGGGILLALQLAAIMAPQRFGLADAGVATRLSFVSVGIWWGLFAIPLLRNVRERCATGRHAPSDPRAPGEDDDDTNWVALTRSSFARLRRTFGEIRQHREAFKFLVAFWLYNDGIGTIVVMANAFGAEIGIGRNTLIAALLAVQILGFPFSLAFGRLAGRVGTKPAILATLAGYTIICIFGYFMRTGLHFWLLAIGVSVVQGGSQALSRSFFAGMIPVARSGEFFGFYNVSSKFAGILGPLVFAAVGQATGTSRYGVVALVVFFLAGAAVLARVRPERSQGPLGSGQPA